MNPLIEQYDKKFFMYHKNKSKLLQQKDTSVSLLINGIHRKSHKGGNVVGLSDNINEAVTCAFTFMLSIIFYHYKDVVNDMSTKCLQAKNLFNIVKCSIIGLEKIGQVLTIMIQ